MPTRSDPDVATLGARIRGGVRVGHHAAGALDLRDALERLSAPPDGLPDDAVRRLGVVLVAGRDALDGGRSRLRARPRPRGALSPSHRARRRRGTSSAVHPPCSRPGVAATDDFRPLRLGSDPGARRPRRPDPGQLRGAPGRAGRRRSDGWPVREPAADPDDGARAVLDAEPTRRPATEPGVARAVGRAQPAHRSARPLGGAPGRPGTRERRLGVVAGGEMVGSWPGRTTLLSRTPWTSQPRTTAPPPSVPCAPAATRRGASSRSCAPNLMTALAAGLAGVPGDRGLRAERHPVGRERDPRGTGLRAPGRAGPGQDAAGPLPRGPAGRGDPVRRRFGPQRGSVRSRSWARPGP